MKMAGVFGLVLLALAGCEAGQTTATGSAASGEAIEQAAAAATLPN